MEYQATAKYIKMSTRRMRLVADSIRALPPQHALDFLAQTVKLAAKPMAKTIASAIANAKQKQANVDTLVFKEIEVMGAPFMKRWRAVSRGQGHGYKKRMTHIRVVLTDTAKPVKEDK
jgi:large subunit ribosomal protein L22